MSANADPNPNRGFHPHPLRTCPACRSPLESDGKRERCRLAWRQARAGVKYPTCRYGVERKQPAPKFTRAPSKGKRGGRHSRVMTGWGDGI